MAALPHAAARAILASAFRSELGRDGSAAELQAAQAVALLETSYGRRWKAPGVGSHNWGAVQTRKGNAPCFRYTDRHRDGRSYVACFKRYASDDAGAADMLRHLYRSPATLDAAGSGSALTFARAMSAAGYFEASPESYAASVAATSATIAEALGEPIYLAPGSLRSPALAVAAVAAAVGVAAALAAAGRKRWAAFAALPLLPP